MATKTITVEVLIKGEISVLLVLRMVKEKNEPNGVIGEGRIGEVCVAVSLLEIGKIWRM